MKDQYKFSHEIRVRYSEIDGQKIVFNAHYHTYLDIAFTEYMREILGPQWIKDPHSLQFDPVLVKSTVHYKKPALLDDILTIYVRVKKIGNSSLTLESLITRDDVVLIEAEMINANYDVVSKTAVPLPEKIKSKIKQFEGL
ncbi:acyl-CoA thioesterase [Fredinandcohnia sp. 179-A 10B2 NHS]|uniref:acyl-CoA thioesterase n=1 Tax=Fredinandcohnia sp. 179-A 10B2 NHS TaxID=3235176 RepID=UPI00399F53D5